MSDLTAKQALEKVKQANIETELTAEDTKARQAALTKIAPIRNHVLDEELDAFDDMLGEWLKDVIKAQKKPADATASSTKADEEAADKQTYGGKTGKATGHKPNT